MQSKHNPALSLDQQIHEPLCCHSILSTGTGDPTALPATRCISNVDERARQRCHGMLSSPSISGRLERWWSLVRTGTPSDYSALQAPQSHHQTIKAPSADQLQRDPPAAPLSDRSRNPVHIPRTYQRFRNGNPPHHRNDESTTRSF